MVRNDLIFDELPLNGFPAGKLEIQRVRLKIQNNHIDIINLYNPNKIVTQPEFQFYLAQMGPRAIFLGDFNAHSPIWDSRVRNSCTTARNLINALIVYPLQLVTPQ
jgi:uncharacterized protein (DUF608 family)